jgi:predicted Zn-dependent protease
MATRLSLLSLIALAFAAGCVQDDGRTFNPIRQEVDPSDEREIGWGFDQQIQQHIEFIDDPVVLGAIAELGQSIVAQIQPQPFIYHFRIVVDPHLNAFAVPGGYIYLHSGTILSAGSVQELAGVLGHEIGHVKGRHIARLQEQTAIPNLLANLAGILATAATGEPGFMVAAQGVNVALQLQYTRELEDEADHLGSVFMARAGYDPDGMVSFFQRIDASSGRSEVDIPPYLYSHPQVGDRVDTVERFSETLTVADVPHVMTDAELIALQTRLRILIAEGRSSWPVASTPRAPALTAPLRAAADEAAASGDLREALDLVEQAERLDPADPRLPLQRGEILEQLGFPRQAALAYERTVELDPTPGLTYLQAGRAHKAAGDNVRATYYVEQAIRRLSPGGSLHRRAHFELLKLVFPVIEDSGIAVASRRNDPDWPGELSRKVFSVADGRLGWSGRVSARWAPQMDRIAVRWIDPAGRVVQETPGQHLRRTRLVAYLDLEEDAPPGRWQVEALLDGDVVHASSFEIVGPPAS